MPWDPMQGERLAPAWKAALDLLDDKEWHTWTEVMEAMSEASDLQWKTCKGLLYGGVREGVLNKQGSYNQRTKRDSRMLRRHR